MNQIKKFFEMSNLKYGERSEKDVFLGYYILEVDYFSTLKKVKNEMNSIKEKVRTACKSKEKTIVINGNIPDFYIQSLLKFILKNNFIFSVVVTDGFKEMREKKNEKDQLAFVIVKNKFN